MKQKAIIIGATGLIGRALVKELSETQAYDEVVLLTRRKVENLPLKCRCVQVDFDKLNNFKTEFAGDVLFSVLGTTLKTAGSQKAQHQIDFGYQFESARLAAANGVKKLILLSSAGANSKSSIFYSRMKGELDEAVQKLAFEQIAIIRPSMLIGKREEFRLSEKVFTPLMYILNIIPFARKYRPIRDQTVARAMINAVHANKEAYQIYELEAVFKLAQNIPAV